MVGLTNLNTTTENDMRTVILTGSILIGEAINPDLVLDHTTIKVVVCLLTASIAMDLVDFFRGAL